jgi:hypothetical protein
MPDDGWYGARDGPFRGSHLVHCAKHASIWHAQEHPCPVCVLEAQVAAATQTRTLMCTECKKGKPA